MTGPQSRLVAPDPDRYDAWRGLVEDYDGGAMDGSGWPAGVPRDTSPAGYAAYLERVRREGDVALALPPDRVHCTYRWIADGDGALLGFVGLRHRLTPTLLERAGHIGYSVRPSRRREGHATRALALAVRSAADLGIDRVLVVCEEDNEASRRVILANGGVHEDTRHRMQRYWIAT